eukprot:Em0001g2572a
MSRFLALTSYEGWQRRYTTSSYFPTSSHEIHNGLKPVSLHAIDSAWSLLYLVMVFPPSLPRIEKAERAAERKIGKRKQEWDTATKRTAARHNERTESLLPDGKRLHKAKEPTSLVPLAGSAPGACHQCGEFGHWRRECPKRVAAVLTPYLRPNQHSAHAEAEFVDCAVAELVAEGYVKKVEQKPNVCSPLSVVANGVGKKRLVVNLRHVNRYLMVHKFKDEDLRVAMLMFKPDVMSAGVLPLLKNLKDPELQRLAQSLPATVLRSRADFTTKKYLGAYQRWKTWAEARHEVPAFPVQAVHLALYLRHLSESVQSKAAVEEAVHALSWLHEVAGLKPATLSGLRRVLAKPKTRKEPITVDMLKAMVESVGPDSSLMEVRLLAMCLISFAGFLSKTDQYREGSSLVVARTWTETCPVSMLERGITKTRTGEKLRKSGGLSYSRAREILLEKITAMGWDPSQFGMHSLRAGGATAVANRGVVHSRRYTMCCRGSGHGVHFMSSVLTTKEIDEPTLIQVIITPTNAYQELMELLCGLLEKDPAMRLGITLYSSTQQLQGAVQSEEQLIVNTWCSSSGYPDGNPGNTQLMPDTQKWMCQASWTRQWTIKSIH